MGLHHGDRTTVSTPLFGDNAVYTERNMLDALHRRYTRISQDSSERFVRAEHVRSSTGYAGYHDQIRTCDFIAQDLWASAGTPIHGHEVKVTRSDWLRELADPAKSEAIKRYCHRWWLVAPDRTIVRDDLPEGWGLMVFDSRGELRVAHRAPELTPEPLTPSFTASLLRAVSKTYARQGVKP